MRLELKLEGARVEGTLEGKPFKVIRRGPATTLEGIQSDEDTFGGLIAPKLLRFCDALMDGANVVIDETDDLDVWAVLPEEVAERVYEAIL